MLSKSETNEKMHELVTLFLMSSNEDLKTMGESWRDGMFEQKLNLDDVFDSLMDYFQFEYKK